MPDTASAIFAPEGLVHTNLPAATFTPTPRLSDERASATFSPFANASAPVVITTTGYGVFTMPNSPFDTIKAEVWAGGGGGSVANYSGGGGGEWRTMTFVGLPAGSQIAYFVGSGGSGLRVTPYSPETKGGDTWFGSDSVLIARGGSGSGPGGSGGIGGTGYAGGSGTAWSGGGGGSGPGAGGGGSGHPLGAGGSATAGTPGSSGVSGASGTRAGVQNANGVSDVEGGSGGHGASKIGGAPGGGGGSDGISNAGGDGGRGQIRLTISASGTATTPPPSGSTRKAPRSSFIQ